MCQVHHMSEVTQVHLRILTATATEALARLNVPPIRTLHPPHTSTQPLLISAPPPSSLLHAFKCTILNTTLILSASVAPPSLSRSPLPTKAEKDRRDKMCLNNSLKGKAMDC